MLTGTKSMHGFAFMLETEVSRECAQWECRNHALSPSAASKWLRTAAIVVKRIRSTKNVRRTITYVGRCRLRVETRQDCGGLMPSRRPVKSRRCVTPPHRTHLANSLRRFTPKQVDRARRPGIKNGCLMCNSATERASDDLASRAVFADHFDRMSGAFTKALNNAKHRGEIRSDARTTDEGRFLATTLLGFSVLMRSRVEPKVVVEAARAARRHLKGLMGDSS